MSTTTDDKSDRLNPSKTHADEAINKIASNNPDPTAKSDQIIAEGRDKAQGAMGLKGKETAAESGSIDSVPSGAETDFYKQSNNPSKKLGFIKGNISNSTKTGGLIALVVSILFIVMFGIFSSGPLKFLHFAEWLQGVHFSDQDTVSAQRIRNLVLYARVPKDGLDKLETTRLGYVATKHANTLEKRMLSNGLQTEYDKGKFKEISFDKSRISDESSLKDLRNIDNDAELKKELSKRLNVAESDIKGTKGKFTISGDSPKQSRKLISSAVRTTVTELPLGRAISFMQSRVLIKKANANFNPITRVKENLKLSAAEKFKDFYDKRRATFTGEDGPDITKKKLTEPDSNNNPEAREFNQATKDANEGLSDRTKLKGLGAKAGGAALAILGVMCATRDISSEVAKMNYGNKAGVAIQASGEVLGLGSKIQEGYDRNTNEALVGADVLGEYDKMYGNYAAAPSYQYQNGQQAGAPLFESEYPQFNPDSQNAIDQTDAFFKAVDGIDGVGVGIDAICGAFTFFGNITSGIASALTAGISEKVEAFFIGNFLQFLATEAEDPTKEEYWGTAIGGELANLGTRIQAAESFNTMGARPLNSAEAQILRENTIAYDTYNDERSFVSKLTDFHDYKSPLSRAYASMNTNIAQNGSAGILTYVSSSFGSLFSPKSAIAASDDEVRYYYGIPKTGFDPVKLAEGKYENPFENANWVANNLTMDSDAVRKFQECTKMVVNPDWSFEALPFPEGLVNYDGLPGYCYNDDDEGLYRLRILALDTGTMSSYACIYEEDQEACGEYLKAEDSWTSDNTGGVLTSVATFNVLGAQHTASDGKLDSWPSGAKRIVDAFDEIKQNGFEVVGLQELEEEQRAKLVELAGNEWGIHPKNPDYTNYRSDNSIIWQSSVYDLVDSGYQKGLKYLGNRPMDAPWVILKHKRSGQEIYVKNTHDPITDNNNNAAQWRYQNALDHREDALARISEGKKVILLGDFNSAEYLRVADDGLTRDQLTYCVLTKGEKTVNAYDAAKNKTGQCPTKSSAEFGIDHIYTSPDIGVQKWARINGLNIEQISDHPIVYSNIVIGSNADGNVNVNAEGWAWPLKGNISINSCFAQPLSKGPHPGLDFSASTGTQLYAVADGTVYGSPGGAWGILTIKHTTSNGDVVYSIYEHMSKITVSSGQRVTAGQPVGLSGNTAPPGGSSGPHLHFGITKDPGVYSYADMGKGKIYNPLVFLNDNQSYKQCSITPRIK